VASLDGVAVAGLLLIAIALASSYVPARRGDTRGSGGVPERGL